MIDYFTNDDDVVLRFPGFAFPMSLSCYNRLISCWLDTSTYIERPLNTEEEK